MPWELIGNSGIKPATNFLGTRDQRPLAIKTNNTERVRVTPTGNVGIGTNNPIRKLHVHLGRLRVSESDGAQTAGVLELANSAKTNYMFTDSPTGHLHLRTDSAAHHVLLQSGGGAQGKVGIGTTNPGSNLTVDVPGSTNPISALSVDVQSFGTGPNSQASHYFRVRDIGAAPPNGYTAFMIRGDGNVGIGTTDPRERLEVVGNIRVTGDVLLSGADCAEDFDVASIGEIEPGTVLVIDEEGILRESSRAYDRRVAGVVSGGGDYRAGLVLDKQEPKADRMPVALMGKVYCKVDARHSPVEVGDLLTTAPTPGHAMKADDPTKAFGAVLGKALRSLKGTQKLVPVLVALQ